MKFRIHGSVERNGKYIEEEILVVGDNLEKIKDEAWAEAEKQEWFDIWAEGDE